MGVTEINEDETWRTSDGRPRRHVKLCGHCGMDIAIRNPSGFCDHLYYPDCCKICEARLKGHRCSTCEGTGWVNANTDRKDPS